MSHYVFLPVWVDEQGEDGIQRYVALPSSQAPAPNRFKVGDKVRAIPQHKYGSQLSHSHTVIDYKYSLSSQEWYYYCKLDPSLPERDGHFKALYEDIAGEPEYWRKLLGEDELEPAAPTGFPEPDYHLWQETEVEGIPVACTGINWSTETRSYSYSFAPLFLLYWAGKVKIVGKGG